MKDTPNEKEVDSFISLTLTTKRIVQEKKGFWEGGTNEIPLNKLDSIGYGYKRNLLLFIIGLIFVIGWWIFSNTSSNNGLSPLILLIVGIIFIVLGLLRHEFVEFRAGTLKLFQEGKNAEQFATTVRSELHKKDYV